MRHGEISTGTYSPLTASKREKWRSVAVGSSARCCGRSPPHHPLTTRDFSFLSRWLVLMMRKNLSHLSHPWSHSPPAAVVTAGQ